jgi:hypothetical protein
MHRPAMSRIALLVLFVVLAHVHADVYMHNPRGSNNRLHERSAARTNGDRLFNSQNNNRGYMHAVNSQLSVMCCMRVVSNFGAATTTYCFDHHFCALHSCLSYSGYNVGVRGSNAATSTVVDLAQKLSLTASDLNNMVRIVPASSCDLFLNP